MALSANKLKEYQVAVKHVLGNTLSGSGMTAATKAGALKMLEAEASGDGSSDEIGTLLSWVKTKPLALKFLQDNADFQKIIDGSLTFTTAANALPSTHIALHAEDKTKEAALKGLFAARINEVDSTFTDTSPNLADNTGGGNALSDAYIMGLYSTWGATKFKALLNKGVVKAIKSESDTDYDTVAEVAAVYDAWAGTVPVVDFFKGLEKVYDAGYTSLKVSELFADAGSVSDFKAHTSDNALKLMASTGGTWAAVSALSGAKLDLLTSSNAMKAIDKCGATYTSMNTVYTADATKLATLLSDSAVGLCSKGYSGFDFAGLSTAYGTTYTTAKDIEFRKMIDSDNWDLYKAGVTYAHALAAGDKLTCVANNNALKNDIVSADDSDSVFTALVANSNYGGLETLGDLC